MNSNDSNDLRAGQRHLQAAFDQAPAGILHLDLAGRILRANGHGCTLLDLPEQALLGTHFSAHMGAEDAAAVQAATRSLQCTPGLTSEHEVRLRRRDGSWHKAHLTAWCMAEDGAACCHVWWLRGGARGQLLDMLQLSDRALAASPNGVVISDASLPDFPIMYANPAFCRITGYQPSDVLGRNGRFLQNADRAQPARHAMRDALDSSSGVHVALRNYRRDGSLFWNDLFIAPVPNQQGRITHYIAVLSDITAHKLNEEKLAFQASHDELTGLPNRSLFNQQLLQAIAQAGAHGTMVSVLCLGIDNLNLVNESLGHGAGDQLLTDVAGALLGCMPAGATVSRHGGNEFFIILGDIGCAGEVTAVCEGIYLALAGAFLFDGQSMHARCSIGITHWPQDGNKIPTLLRYADMALSRAREQGGGKVQFFSSEMNQRTQERTRMEAALRLAIAGAELQLFYQPLVDLQSGHVTSLEALLRWNHPELGLIEAQRFIPVAEDAGLIEAIGTWVLQRTCRDMRAWSDAGLGQVHVAINVSPKQFRDRQLAGRLAAALSQLDLAPAMLTLEITEAVLLQDAAASAHRLAQLKALGVCLTLDDFGTGYSSLSNLKRFSFDSVKIDRAFIGNIVSDTDDAALAKTIIAVAHHLGIKVAADGVETEAQCDFLRRNMCDQIQGHFFAPPMGPEGIATLLRERRTLPPHLLRIQKRERTLLLVDDEPNILASLKRLLRRDGYQIFTANNGQQGLELLASHAIDVIVSDQRMPGMIGADFLRKAKQLYPDTIRIMLSGYTELQSVTDAVNEGDIYKFLTKPWEDDLLRGHIADAFRLKEIADENERLNLEVRTANHELASANRKMEQLLREKQQQISRDEVSLDIARELLQLLPLAIIGIDDDGMIAFVNGAAETLFRRSGALLGNAASLFLPALFPAGLAPPTASSHRAVIEGGAYAVAVYPMGAHSASRGSLITLTQCARQA